MSELERLHDKVRQLEHELSRATAEKALLVMTLDSAEAERDKLQKRFDSLETAKFGGRDGRSFVLSYMWIATVDEAMVDAQE